MLNRGSAEPVPFSTDEQGTIRVGDTRVTLDIVVVAFQGGATPEEIVQQLPVLALADVYSVLGYYLHHQDDIDAYLRTRQHTADEIRVRIEQQQPHNNLRERLLSRQKQQES